jgi:hypothetical protein
MKKSIYILDLVLSGSLESARPWQKYWGQPEPAADPG